jgi:complement component 1 Q subcomponent-binding protein
MRQCQRSFSISARAMGEGASDVSVSQKLSEELKYENEAASSDAAPEFLKDFNAKGVWTITDTAGQDEVTLTRKFGNENLRLMFSIADLQAEEDFANEEESGESEEGSEPENTSAIRASLSITKTNGSGALNIDTVCQEGRFIVDNIAYYKDGNIGTELTAEADWKRRGLYLGPVFDTLDVGLQEEFEKYLGERGIDESLANFIPEYAEHKEQTEYVNWLKNVKTFVDL